MKEIKEIGLSDLQNIPNSIIVDIREKEEFLEQNIGGINIPAHEITTRLSEI